MCQSAEQVEQIHAFEAAGMGQAPYRVVGVSTTEDRQLLNRYLQANGMTYTTNLCGGTCDHCGTAIWTVYTIEDRNGQRFKVGCDCVLKAGGAGLKAKVTRLQNLIVKEQRAARDQAKIAAVQARLADQATRDRLTSLPHPNAHMAARGLNGLDYVEFIWKQSGVAGRVRMAKMLDKMLAGA